MDKFKKKTIEEQKKAAKEDIVKNQLLADFIQSRLDDGEKRSPAGIPRDEQLENTKKVISERKHFLDFLKSVK